MIQNIDNEALDSVGPSKQTKVFLVISGSFWIILVLDVEMFES